MSGKEMKYIHQAFDSNWIAPVGPNVDGFEKELGQYLKSNVAVISSGTAALHLALIVLGVQRDDFVLCQSLTFAGSANPILYQGAIPVFIDSEKSTWNICPSALEDALKYFTMAGKKPKAIIGVHLYGMPCMLDDISYLSRKYEVPFVEDAAEALGSAYRGIKLGSFGDLGVLSFNGNKIITTSGGGAMISNRKDYVMRAKFLANQARDAAAHYEHSQIGYNYGLSNICAGIGRGQLEVLEDRVKMRRANFTFYNNKLKWIPGISFQNEPEASFSNRWLTCILIDHKTSGNATRDHILLQLAQQNIEARPLWKPMHIQPLFQNTKYFGGNVSEELFQKGLCLPSGSNLCTADLARICNLIIQISPKH